MTLGMNEILFDPEPHTYTFRGKVYPSVTQVIRLAGMGDDFSHVNPERLEYCRRRGQMVHQACQFYDEGDLNWDSLDAEIVGYVEAYVNFRIARKITVIESEKRMVDAKVLKLAGTPDLVCWMDGHRVVIDRKTSQHMSRSMGLQTAGYKLLRNILYPKQIISDRFGLRLSRNGNFALIPHRDPGDFPCFMDCIDNARSEQKMIPWRQQYGKRPPQSKAGLLVGDPMGMVLA